MALPTDLEIKSYLRLDTDEEDLLIFTLNQTAQAVVASKINLPLEAAATTFYGRTPRRGYRGEAAERLTIPKQPCATTATITDVDGETVDADTYTIEPLTGWVNAALYEAFAAPPYTIVVNVGLTAHPDYDAVIDPIARQAILDLASDYWNRRNPGGVFEQSGGQVSITYTEDEVARRTKDLIELLRVKGRAW